MYNVKNYSNVNNEIVEVVHEIKNSIGVCKGYLDIMDSNNFCSRKYIAVMKEELDRSLNIMIRFMRNEDQILVMKNIYINDLVKESCGKFELLYNKSIFFEMSYFKKNILIYGNYNQLLEVFCNYIKNAIESISGNNGVIKVHCYTKFGFCYIVISDNGVGISDENLNKIGCIGFTTKSYGNGIGINFSNNIIRKHNGEVRYISKVGVGTKVVVKLPMVML